MAIVATDLWLSMTDIRRIEDMIELDVFLFGGVPEIPNPVYGRDAYASVQSRLTRSGLSGRRIEDKSRKFARTLQNITVNLKDDTLEFGKFIPDEEL